MGVLARNGFKTKEQIVAFLTVVFSGEIIYSCFESFKIPFYNKLLAYYNLTNTQFGMLFMMLGVAVFFYVPGGWINNRFPTRTVLITSLLYRFVSALFMILCKPSFPIMLAVTFSWGVTDAIFWPAVVKGVVLFSGPNNKGLGLGLLSALRAGGEAMLNGILIGVLSVFSGSLTVFKWGMVVYCCFTLPVAALVYFYVPRDPQKEGELNGEEATPINEPGINANREALLGLWQTLKMGRVWLAGLVGMCVYWVYSTLVYTTPFFTKVYEMGEDTASLYVTAIGFILGLGGALAGGIVADKIFKSSTFTLGLSLTVSSVIILSLTVLPRGSQHTILAVVVVSVCVFFIMMSKGIQQAPVAELHLPSKVLGSALSVNSFMGFASILWAMPINGAILDCYKDNPAIGFSIIYTLIFVVGMIGAVAAFYLEYLNRRDAKRKLKLADA